HVAGLTHYYGRFKFHALGLSWDEELGASLIILSCPGNYPTGKLEYPIGMGVSVPGGVLDLAMEVRDNDLQFFWRKSGEGEWQAVGPVLDASVISDEGGGLNEHGSFTGAFAAMFAFDITGHGKPADFDGFTYRVL
ncbi:MAG TPA: glycoside hydrolase 43 family protein, partial [Ensifer sp.]|nr:glycoside hydrolase 43 family protein [Ensifer sp.]